MIAAINLWLWPQVSWGAKYEFVEYSGRWENLVSAINTGTWWDRTPVSSNDNYLFTPRMRLFDAAHYRYADFTPGGWATVTTDGGVCSGRLSFTAFYWHNDLATTSRHDIIMDTSDITKTASDNGGGRINAREYVNLNPHLPQTIDCSIDKEYVTVTVVNTMRAENVTLYTKDGSGRASDGRKDLYLTIKYKRHELIETRFVPPVHDVTTTTGTAVVSGELKSSGTYQGTAIITWPKINGVRYKHNGQWVDSKTEEISMSYATYTDYEIQIQSNEPGYRVISVPVTFNVL